MTDMLDDKLKLAVEEIEIVLKKYDIAGLVSVASQNQGYRLDHLNPTWSGIVQDDTSLQVPKREDFPTKEAWLKQMTVAVGVMAELQSQADRGAKQLESILKVLTKNGGNLSYRSQNIDPT